MKTMAIALSSIKAVIMASFAICCEAAEASKPIVDVRFDAPYHQIDNSRGDEWAPTWGRDDVLYTGADDGTSFGGIPINLITFGKLVGNDPYDLKGVTVNGMADFKEPLITGPENAFWNSIGSLAIDGSRYQFARCDGH